MICIWKEKLCKRVFKRTKEKICTRVCERIGYHDIIRYICGSVGVMGGWACCVVCVVSVLWVLFHRTILWRTSSARPLLSPRGATNRSRAGAVDTIRLSLG